MKARPHVGLKIVEPVKISGVIYWWSDSGVGMEVIDAKEKKHSFCLYSPAWAGIPQKNKELFIGATYPTHEGAKMVDVRGPEESALYGVLLRAIDKHKEKDAILAKDIDWDLWRTRKLGGTDLFETHAFFHRLEGHFLKE